MDSDKRVHNIPIPAGWFLVVSSFLSRLPVIISRECWFRSMFYLNFPLTLSPFLRLPDPLALSLPFALAIHSHIAHPSTHNNTFIYPFPLPAPSI